MKSDFAGEIARAAAERWTGRTGEREKKAEAIRRGGFDEVEGTERLYKRILHLERSALADHARQMAGAAPEGIRTAASGARAATLGLERVLGDPDFLGIEFLELGFAVARFVARIHIRTRPGRTEGYGTGFMVSPRLLLTNNHVLEDPRAARFTEVEFDYQKDRAGRLMPVETYSLDPATFFQTNRPLDYTLVAVAGRSTNGAPLDRYGWSRLVGTEGKILHGDPVNIIQHPAGRTKQLVLRSNRLLDLLPDFAHYETDTEPGSSGSPVYNDLWEVIALHHSGVPNTSNGDILTQDGNVWRDGDDPRLIEWVANEGVRVSRIISDVEGMDLAGEEDFLRDELLTREPPHPFEAAQMADKDRPRPHPSAPVPPPAPLTPQAGGRRASITIPLTVSVELGEPAGGDIGQLSRTAPDASTRLGRRVDPPAAVAGAGIEDEVKIDPDYDSRSGYDPEFLGRGSKCVPFPEIPEEMEDLLGNNKQAKEGDPPYLLRYHHFSVVMHRLRRLALFTAVNIDGKTLHRFKRGRDRWYLDPRIEDDEQIGEELYSRNPLDRGHLVRRIDPSWGTSRRQAQYANDDTFHFTNCSPQHSGFNQNKTTWAGLEDYILDNADSEGLRVSLFTGPVLTDEDPAYRDVTLPREFWKVVAVVNRRSLSVTAYLLTQEELIADLPLERAFTYGKYLTFQVPLSKIRERTGLDFSELSRFDPLDGTAHEGLLENFGTGRDRGILIDHPGRIVL